MYYFNGILLHFPDEYGIILTFINHFQTKIRLLTRIEINVNFSKNNRITLYIYIFALTISFFSFFLSNIYPIQTYYSRARAKSLFQVNGEVKKPDLAIDFPLSPFRSKTPSTEKVFAETRRGIVARISSFHAGTSPRS